MLVDAVLLCAPVVVALPAIIALLSSDAQLAPRQCCRNACTRRC
jgi:hypothetical protein